MATVTNSETQSNLLDLYRSALTNPDVAQAVGAVLTSDRFGHKVLVWDAALTIVERHIGPELMAPHSGNGSTRWKRAIRLRNVMSGRFTPTRRAA